MRLSLMFVITLTPWVITIIALRRGMIAQESIAESLRMITKTQKQA